MLLTLSQSGKPEFGTRALHDIASPPVYARQRSPAPRAFTHVLSPVGGNAYAMSTSHRGLPPPSSMTLPDPSRQQPPPQPPPPTLLQTQPPPQPPQNALPAPPSAHWQQGDDSARQWVQTKAEEERTKQEEERRRQEEERTRQESYKYEQRLIERAILRESIQGGVPPQMIPVIFAGIGGSSLASASVDLLQQYAAQLQNVAQQMQPSSTEVSPEQLQQTQMINPPVPNPYAAPPQLPTAIQQPPPTGTYHQAGAGPRPILTGPTSAPRGVPQPGLSRINTIDIAQPSSSTQSQAGHSDQTASSPGIYFHHWVPPGVQEGKGTHPPTPSGRNEPSSAHPSSTAESEHRDSPRKRKATGGHQSIPPPPPPQPRQSSPPPYAGPSGSRSRGNSGTQQGQSRSRPGKPDDGESSRGGHFRKDSVAQNPRHGHDSYPGPEPYNRPPSHTGQHHHVDRRDLR